METKLPGSRREASSQSEGTSYKKVLCALFDLAILRTYSNESFYHFVYHDGILEGLDVRKRRLVLRVLRETATKYGVQCIISVIEKFAPEVASPVYLADHLCHLRSRISSTSCFCVPRLITSRLPSRDKSKSGISSLLKWVICLGVPPAIGWRSVPPASQQPPAVGWPLARYPSSRSLRGWHGAARTYFVDRSFLISLPMSAVFP